LCNYLAKEKKHYFLAGRFMAYCLVHGGPKPNFLHPKLFDAVSKGLDKMQPEIMDIHDVDMQEKLLKVSLQ
jgi:hypothetical protein